MKHLINRLFHLVLAVTTVFSMAGCQTPPAVYELAGASSGNAGSLQGHLSQVSAQSRLAANTRADLIVAMEAFNAQLAAALSRELYMQQHSRPKAEWTQIQALIAELTSLRDDLARIEASKQTVQAARRKEILEQQTTLDNYQSAMRDTAAALSALAERESSSARAKFVAAFAREVRSDFKKSLDSDEAGAKAAGDLITGIKSKLKKTAPDSTDNPY